MSKLNMKQSRETALNIINDGVTNADKLREAVPFLVQYEAAIKQLRTKLAEDAVLCKAVADQCGLYASKYTGWTDNGKTLLPSGVKTADMTVTDENGNEVTYHFVDGFAGYHKSDGTNMTQEDMRELPQSWLREKVELNVQAINDQAKDIDLYNYGIERLPSRKWELRDS